MNVIFMLTNGSYIQTTIRIRKMNSPQKELLQFKSNRNSSPRKNRRAFSKINSRIKD